MLPPGYDQVLAARAAGSVSPQDVPRDSAGARLETTESVGAAHMLSPSPDRSQSRATPRKRPSEQAQQVYTDFPQGEARKRVPGSQAGGRPLPSAPR